MGLRAHEHPVLPVSKAQEQHVTNHNFAIYFLQDESSLAAQLCRLCSQHPKEPLLPQSIVTQPELEELLQDVLGRLVLLEKAHVVKENLEGRAGPR